ncbi:hypothetical protein [Sutcliffiella rhizosphaerae]|uniref:Uncharacterized protein n=1 Tax=Sutcliffiella rhizosphaerae TaxID=2880967 RepID=A0ABM8YRM9_9BACI|nr:hypothetical protein [Sutcliffiella rhizosphaerae]CAG9622606.1 hypothetical protein BACCIP111883_03397 [Sutcliffiella rhizosphaerae]
MRKYKKVYANPSTSPSLVIKTNLDREQQEENPYYSSSLNHQEEEKLDNFFFEHEPKGDYHE